MTPDATINPARWHRALLLAFTLGFFVPAALAAAGDIRFQDNFDDGNMTGWTTGGGGGVAGVNNYTSSSGAFSMFLSEGTRHAISPVIDISDLNVPGAGAVFTAWLRRGVLGAPAGQSDMPEYSDQLEVYYFSTGGWVLVQTFDGEFGFPWDTGGDVFQFSFELPAAGLHTGLRLGFRLRQGGGLNQDFWHIDDPTVTELQASPPLAAGVCDEFEGSTATNWTFAGVGSGGVSGATANTAPQSMFLSEGVMTATSNTFDATTVQTMTVWIRRGSDSFSEDVDVGEDLELAYWDGGAYQSLDTFLGGPPSGEIFPRFYDLTTAGHANFNVRLRMTAGSGAGFDFWHVDSVCFLTTPPPFPDVDVTKTGCEDGTSCNTSVNYGDIVEYTILVENNGLGPASDVEVVDDLDPYTSFGLDNYGAGVRFLMVDSGSTLTLGGPQYSADNAGTYTHVPVSGGGGASPGYDGQITDFRIPMIGTMPAGTSFEIQFKVEVK